MFYKLDKDGNYVGVKSAENKNWEFQTEIDIPDGMIKPKLVNEVWIETFEPEIVVPEKVPLWCLLQQLKEDGLYDLAMEQINLLEEPIRSRAETFLQNGNDAYRNSPTIEMLGALLEKTKTEIDTLFINADKLEL